MDLREDACKDPDQPGLDLLSSEDFLKSQKGKLKKPKPASSLLSPGEKDDSLDCSSNNSRYKTKIRNVNEDVEDDFVYRKSANPSHSTYLEKTKSLPEQFKEPKFHSRNIFEKVGMACYQKPGSSLLRKYLENITRIFTGSDGDVNTELDKQLKDDGLIRESILGNKIWIAQTI
jgi:hypothetical protein